jgi:hypothetical protein
LAVLESFKINSTAAFPPVTITVLVEARGHDTTRSATPRVFPRTQHRGACLLLDGHRVVLCQFAFDFFFVAVLLSL